MRHRRVARGMAGPLVAALGVHVALATIALSVRPRALPEMIDVPGVTLVPVVMAAAADTAAVAEPIAAGPSVGADLQEAQVPEAVAWPNVLPPISVTLAPAAPVPAAGAPAAVASRSALARTPARITAPTDAPTASSAAAPVATAGAPRAGPDAAMVAAWRAALSAWVEQNRRYPPVARFRQEEGVVQVRFELDSGGRVLRVEVQRESGSAALDAAAVALLFGNTLPAPPRELAPELLVVTLPIRYRLQ